MTMRSNNQLYFEWIGWTTRTNWFLQIWHSTTSWLLSRRSWLWLWQIFARKWMQFTNASRTLRRRVSWRWCYCNRTSPRSRNSRHLKTIFGWKNQNSFESCRWWVWDCLPWHRDWSYMLSNITDWFCFIFAIKIIVNTLS